MPHRRFRAFGVASAALSCRRGKPPGVQWSAAGWILTDNTLVGGSAIVAENASVLIVWGATGKHGGH